MSRTRTILLAAMAALLLFGGAAALAQQNQRVYLPVIAGARATATPPPSGGQTPVQSGRATYYVTADGGGNCMFDPTPSDLMVAAISHVNYNDPQPAAWCGAYVEVTGELGSVVVRIVDKCPDEGCTRNHLDLSPQAFAKIAPIEKGIVPITWRLVSPNLDRRVSYHIKPGSSQWWTAIQVRGHRNPIRKLEYRAANGSWVELERQEYNYFIATNMGLGPYTLRATDMYGNSIVDSNIVLGENVETRGSSQFPAGP
jgi:expansin